MSTQPERVRIRIRGAVPGVGFRPFLYGLAERHNMAGFVLNDSNGVLAEIEGTAIRAFISMLHREPPPLARIDAMHVTSLPLLREPGFTIRETSASPNVQAQPAPDAVTCVPLLHALVTPGLTRKEGANLFHGTLIAGLADWIAQNAAVANHDNVAFSGGCFVNRVLSEGLIVALHARRLTPFLPCALPSNDGGLCLGQAMMGRAHLAGHQQLTPDQAPCA